MKNIVYLPLLVILFSCSNPKYYYRSNNNIIVNQPMYYGFIMTNQNNINEWNNLLDEYYEILEIPVENNNNYNNAYSPTFNKNYQKILKERELTTFANNYFTKFFISTEKNGNKIIVDIVRPNNVYYSTNKFLNNDEFGISIEKIVIESKNNNWNIILSKNSNNEFEGTNYYSFNFNDIDIYVYSNDSKFNVIGDKINKYKLSLREVKNETGNNLYKNESERYLSTHLNYTKNLKEYNYDNYYNYDPFYNYESPYDYNDGRGIKLNFSYIHKNNFGFSMNYQFNYLSNSDSISKEENILNNSIYYHGLHLGPTYTLNILRYFKIDLKTLLGLSAFKNVPYYYNYSDNILDKGDYISFLLGLDVRFNLSKKLNLIISSEYFYLPEYEYENYNDYNYFNSIKTLNIGIGIGYRF